MIYATFIESCLNDGAKIASELFNKVSGVAKPEDNNQVFTEADLMVGSSIIERIQKAYPEHSIIDEEAGVIIKDPKYIWVIDPIDGTSNYANGSPQYGIMLGLLIDGQPYAGGIVLPYFAEFFTAEKEAGAFCNGKKLLVNQETELKKCLVAYGIDGHPEDLERSHKEFQTLEKLVLNIRNLRCSNSAFDTALFLKGSYAASINQSSKVWDNVAQQILCSEAGALYTTFAGAPLDYAQALTEVNKNYTWCAANPSLHQQIQKLILN